MKDNDILSFETWNLMKIKKTIKEDPKKIDLQDDLGMTFLMFAAMKGDKSRIDFLKKHGANLSLTNRSGMTALIYVIMYYKIHKDKNLIEMLIDVQNINHQDKQGNTALMVAVHWGCVDAVKLLLEYGADVNIKNEKEETALIEAQKMGYKDIEKILS